MSVKAVRPGFTGRVINVNVETVTLPNGATVDLEIIRHPGGAAVAAINERGEICLLRQYRHAVERWLLELPAGKIDHGDDPFVTARRELEEETGLVAAEWQPLGGVISSPGVFTEIVHLYLATGLEQRRARPEVGEVFQIVWMPLDEAARLAVRGEIDDGKTIAGIWRAQARLGPT
jgi:8-oxo-dGTP pyrophosphatase MutT (NUDIX family)